MASENFITRAFLPNGIHWTGIRSGLPNNGHWPRQILIQNLLPENFLRTWYWGYRIVAGFNNGFRYKVIWSMNGLPVLTYETSANSTNAPGTQPDALNFGTASLASPNGLELINVSVDGFNPTTIQPFTFMVCADEVRMELLDQWGIDADQVPRWRLDVFSQKPDRHRSVLGLTQKV